MCAMPPHHNHHQAQLIKPLAGSISVVVSRSRHRHVCKTTDHSCAAIPIGILFPPSDIQCTGRHITLGMPYHQGNATEAKAKPVRD
ncbi:hypothetical protein D9611_014994 [Ephemerocybe angulata]|uniref:Uncharacterized protein n=1 Tax=Ephemerocybe angulata TaxID=980116 RepID=A0A8H5FER5_9AGAR|nr:hypothetical protein D9611_014994 [Tulosesus angulatus]